jgi:hypothetical protein
MVGPKVLGVRGLFSKARRVLTWGGETSRVGGYGECSSAGRAQGCGPCGRGFESHHSPQRNPSVCGTGASKSDECVTIASRNGIVVCLKGPDPRPGATFSSACARSSVG